QQPDLQEEPVAEPAASPLGVSASQIELSDLVVEGEYHPRLAATDPAILALTPPEGEGWQPRWWKLGSRSLWQYGWWPWAAAPPYSPAVSRRRIASASAIIVRRTATSLGESLRPAGCDRRARGAPGTGGSELAACDALWSAAASFLTAI